METKKMTYRERLKEVAEDNYGYITTADLAALKVPVVEVRKLANRGKLKHVRRGVYRFPDTRPSDRDGFAAALAEVGAGAFLVRDAVLALHGLGLVNPNRIRVATLRRVRHQLPKFVAVEQRDADDEVEIYEGLRTTTVAKAILDCRGYVMTERLRNALDQAAEQGLVTRKELLTLRKALRKPAVA